MDKAVDAYENINNLLITLGTGLLGAMGFLFDQQAPRALSAAGNVARRFQCGFCRPLPVLRVYLLSERRICTLELGRDTRHRPGSIAEDSAFFTRCC